MKLVFFHIQPPLPYISRLSLPSRIRSPFPIIAIPIGILSVGRRRSQKMVRGTLEVLLVGAKGLENTDFLNNMDPYALLICRTQEQKSSVASGKGTEPDWNETFVFTTSEDTTELIIKLMDSDVDSDDFVGEASIPLEPVYVEGQVPPTVYNVVKDGEYHGEIKIGLTFTPEGHRPDQYS